MCICVYVYVSCVSHQKDPLCFDDHGPASRVQHERLHKVVLRHVHKSGLDAGSKDDLFGLFRAYNIKQALITAQYFNAEPVL